MYGFDFEVNLESTIYSNHHLIIKSSTGEPVGVAIISFGKEDVYRLGDYVKVEDDGRGYICPGIRRPGIGQITEIRRDDTDHFYGVTMDSGERGTMKYTRIAKRASTREELLLA